MSRFFVEKENCRDGKAFVAGTEARHITEVMRLVPGDEVVIFDGTGAEYSGVIETQGFSSKSVTVKILHTRKMSRDALNRITLVQAIPKKNRMDNIVEKATELGVLKIIPVVTARTIVRPVSGKKHTERWQRIALSASKQSGRADIPEITEIETFPEAAGETKGSACKLIACLKENNIPLREVLSQISDKKGDISVMIGPEGDFTPEEISLAEQYGYKPVSLGNRVLKSDTAGLFVLSVLEYEFGANL